MNSIIGRWTVDSYLINDTVCSPDMLAEYMGEAFAQRNNSIEFFFDDGTFALRLIDYDEKLNEFEGTYATAESTIKATAEGDSILLHLDGDLLSAEYPHQMTIRFKKAQ